MTQEITMGSLFSGSGGFELAGSIFGIRPIWASEIEPFPILVTTKNFPEMKHLGDINKLNGADLEPVTIIAGGSPCQDMSIAGKREGLDGSRRENGRQPDASWATISPSLGECLMPNTGECPKEESVSTLSQILEETPHQKYYLSEKACLGILRRAEKRGKELPEILRLALIRQAQMMSSAMTSATDAE